ncbi:PREDICTED: uncharacterized protein LOC105965716 [Erythranthe guttata]|nr:PREDICTED: uncharacterized protein LOC105965716 [Erythranthe guttata]|eukprot:XP_012845741.1 PREDICTED: uncharacterized protein LOC105965716 [Erythranthe guttata]
MFPAQDAQPSNMLVKIEDVNKAGPTPPFSSLTEMVLKLMDENRNLRNSLTNALHDLQNEEDKNTALKNQLQDATDIMQQMDQEQEKFVTSFEEERNRREQAQQHMQRRLKEATETIEGLLRKVKMLEAQGRF